MTETVLAAEATAAVSLDGLSPGRLRWHRFLKHRAAVTSGVVLILLCLSALCAPLIEQVMGFDSNRVDLLNRFAAPSWQHLLGTDELGRDVLLRLLHGGRISLTVGLVTALVAMVIGTVVGLPSGYYGGRLDAVLMRFTDTIIALPLLPFLIILAALDLNKLPLPDGWISNDTVSLYRIVVIVAVFGWTTVARLVRGATLAARQQDYVRAAVALGAGNGRIMLRHILPNVASPIIVATTLSVGKIILLESVLSFLALGIQPPIPSWGNMLTNAQELIWSTPGLVFYPGLMIFITVIAFNFLGDGLQDALDPRADTDRR